MAIRKSSLAGGRGGRPSALELFTDRDNERELLRDFFQRLAHPTGRPGKPILSFWGIGGIGKTTLLKKAKEELGADLPNFRIVSLDLDHDSWRPNSPIEKFYWHLRSQLWESKERGSLGGGGFETPLLIISILLSGVLSTLASASA
jgi:hypothetical protein